MKIAILPERLPHAGVLGSGGLLAITHICDANGALIPAVVVPGCMIPQQPAPAGDAPFVRTLLGSVCQ
jgi:hypothetical protein